MIWTSLAWHLLSSWAARHKLPHPGTVSTVCHSVQSLAVHGMLIPHLTYHFDDLLCLLAPDISRSSSTWRQSFVTMSTRPINPASTCWSPEDKLSPFNRRFVGIDGREEFFSKVDTGRESHRGVSITTNRSFSCLLSTPSPSIIPPQWRL